MLAEYLKKQAEGGVIGASTDVMRDLFWTAAATAALAGIGTGFAMSRMTSPRESDRENDRKEYLLSDMQLRKAKYDRKASLDSRYGTTEEASKPAREIRL